MSRGPALLALAALAACPPREDVTPQIRVVPGAAQRIALLGSHAPSPPGSEPPRDAVAHGARVHAMRAGEELGGSHAAGRPGDLVIENDEVVFVVDQLGGSVGFAESGGNVIDAADARVRKDELGQMFTYFGTFPRQAVYDALTSGVLEGGAAFVEVRGRELRERDVVVVTKYTLRSGDRALLIETTLTNRGARPATGLRLGDAVQWGGAEKLAPGKPLGFRGAARGPFVGGVGRSASYALTSTDGAIESVSGGSWTDTMQTPPITLAPGDSRAYARVFVVGQRGDSASIVTELARAAGGGAGALTIELADAAGRAVPADDGARVSLALPTGAEVLTLRAAGGALTGDVPLGTYDLKWTGTARRTLGPPPRVTVTKDGAARATLAVSGAGRVAIMCVDAAGGAATPCKATFAATDGAAPPDFGPAHASGPAKSQVTVGADGSVDVAIAPGKWRVTLSRGPEWALTTVDVEAKDGETVTRTAKLARVVDTRGYVATDFHQHTAVGADAPVAARDRLIANAAEGVEVSVASEHNVVADLMPVARALGLAPHLVSIPGDELTSDAVDKPWGHANVFPLTPDPSLPRGGAPVLRGRTAREVLAGVRDPGRVVQINHPRTGLTGYFDQLDFDAARGEGKDPAYEPAFDALEVWNGRHVVARDRVLRDLFALLRTGHVVTATADTDTHGVVGQEAGYPRTYVAVARDDAFDAWDGARARDLVDGVRVRRDVVLTNGPFLRVRAPGGVGIGGLARADARGVVRLEVHLEAAPWVAIDSVRVVRASDGGTAAEAKIALKPTPRGARVADVVLVVTARADDAVVVIAQGAAPLTPVLEGDAAEIAPWAMSGAIWIDADGDGAALGRR